MVPPIAPAPQITSGAPLTPMSFKKRAGFVDRSVPKLLHDRRRVLVDAAKDPIAEIFAHGLGSHYPHPVKIDHWFLFIWHRNVF